MANLPHSNANREAGAQPVLVCHLLALGYVFFSPFPFFFADSAKCLHEANALCQIVY